MEFDPANFSTSWRIFTPDHSDMSLFNLKPGPHPGPTVIASVEIKFSGDWNEVALMGAKMVQMATQMKQQAARISVAPANALEMIKGGR